MEDTNKIYMLTCKMCYWWWDNIRRKAVWPVWKYYQGIRLEYWGKPLYLLVRICDSPAKVRNRYLPITSLKTQTWFVARYPSSMSRF